MTEREVLDAVNREYRPGGGRVAIAIGSKKCNIIPNNHRGGIIVGCGGRVFDFAWDDEGQKWVAKA